MSKKKIKVVNIIEDGRLGGPQIRIAEVAKRLIVSDIETIVVFPKRDSNAFKERLEKGNIKNVQFPLHRLTKQKLKLIAFIIFFLFEIRTLLRFFKKEQIDIVHVSGGSWQYKGVIAGKLAGCKVVWHLNDTKMPWIFRFLFKVVNFVFVDAIIVAANKVRKYYIEDLGITGKPVFEIQAPVDTEWFRPETNKPSLTKNNFKVVTVANINPVKGLETFLEMVALVNANETNKIDFDIVGEQFESQLAYSAKLNRLKDELGLQNVRFKGASNKIKNVLNMADIYICSSVAEASPLSVWEAMSMGKAIVATDVGDVSRFITSGENGFIVPIRDAKAMADKVLELMSDKALREEFGRRARNTAIKKLDLAICAERHKELYLNMQRVNR